MSLVWRCLALARESGFSSGGEEGQGRSEAVLVVLLIVLTDRDGMAAEPSGVWIRL